MSESLHRIVHRNHVFVTVCILVFPIAWITLHWTIMMKVETSDATLYQKGAGSHGNQTTTAESSKTTTFLPFREPMVVVPPALVLQNSEKELSVAEELDMLRSTFDPSLHFVIPSSVYQPRSSSPLQVLYIGAFTDTTTRDDVILDALERSYYTKVSATFLYSQNDHTLLQQQRHSFHAEAPAAIVVDWSALARDCHVLHRIISHMHGRNSNGASFLQDNNNNSTTTRSYYYLVLLDASASPRAETCSHVLLTNGHFRGLERIRLAKRSIVMGRRWNSNTKPWVAPGALVPNPPPVVEEEQNGGSSSNTNKRVGVAAGDASFHILHWTGSAPEAFVDELRFALADAEHNSRPVDVSHYWKSSSRQPQQHHFYYNRLRQSVSLQLNETARSLIATMTQDHNGKMQTMRWVERVGIDEQATDTISAEDEKGGSDEDKNDEPEASSSLHAALLASSKIVVVAQADEWEDHDDRLMEALASGAMVLCDAMIAPPAGLVHNTNVVFYDDLTTLDGHLRYYLNPSNAEQRELIARNGVEYALSRHRSWHVLETLLFGKALTLLSDKKKKPLTDKGPARRKTSADYKNAAVVIVSL